MVNIERNLARHSLGLDKLGEKGCHLMRPGGKGQFPEARALRKRGRINKANICVQNMDVF